MGAAGHSWDGTGPGFCAAGWTAACSISFQLAQYQQPLCATQPSEEDAGSLFEYLHRVREVLIQGHRKGVVLVKMPLFTKPLRLAGLPGTEVLKASSAMGVRPVLLTRVGESFPFESEMVAFSKRLIVAKYT